jgi:hypothetical protein
MRQAALVLLVAVLPPGYLLGQTPPPGQGRLLPPGVLGAEPLTREQTPPPNGKENLVPFDYRSADLRWVNGRWELHSGGVKVRDFGKREADARDALRVVRALRLTQYGTVGHPQPIMEYWLSDGQAPRSTGSGLRMTPFDQGSLRVEEIQGQWCVRDDNKVLFNFGPERPQAEQALAVIRHYGFNRVGYVGHPTPLMIYFVGDGNGTGVSSIAPASIRPKPIRVPDKNGKPGKGHPDLPADAVQVSQLQQQVQLGSAKQLSPPPQASALHLQRFDPRKAEVKQEGGRWTVVVGGAALASFSTPQYARQALEVFKTYRFTERCLIGAAPPSFAYYLVNGQPPRGLKLGIPNRGFRHEDVAVKEYNGSWVVYDGDRPLVNLGAREKDARELAQVIQRLRFDHLCWVGNPAQEGFLFLVRAR